MHLKNINICHLNISGSISKRLPLANPSKGTAQASSSKSVGATNVTERGQTTERETVNASEETPLDSQSRLYINY